jgi:nucleoside-diphosphate-sugar epimerase
LFDNIYKNKTTLITGHTGFKGSWLAIWLKELGADGGGYSLAPPNEPNNFEAVRKTPSVKVLVNVTSDKCYENREWVWGYRENDPERGSWCGTHPIFPQPI